MAKYSDQWRIKATPDQWRRVPCGYCKAAIGADCIDTSPPLFGTPWPDRAIQCHQSRNMAAKVVESQSRAWEEHKAYQRSPAGIAQAAHAAQAQATERAIRAERDERWRAQDAARDAAAARADKRDAKREAGGYNWDDDDPVGKQRQRLVQWLMMRRPPVPLEKAKIIARRKYP